MTYEEAQKKLEEVIGKPIVEITEWDGYYATEPKTERKPEEASEEK